MAPDGASPKGFGAKEAALSVDERLIVALDVPDIDQAKRIVRELDGIVSFFKLGPWLQWVAGFEDLIDWLIEHDKKVFADTKGCDIPETMIGNVTGASARGISFLTVHGNGEVTSQGLKAAVNAKGRNLKLFLVTVLTSLGEEDLKDMGYEGSVEKMALQRAQKALDHGFDGVITSGREAAKIRELAGSDQFLIVTPGIRPAGSISDDQKRVMTPYEAIHSGADYLVVGRPIIKASDTKAAALAILDEMHTAFGAKGS
jgi:orotidine-5'-phosphate decarboxylase